MSVFEFQLTLFAIVAGLGISLLVRSVGQMIEARDRVRLYWVHSCWIALTFVAYVVTWFSLWRYEEHAPWTVLQALLLLCLPILLYLISHLAVPELEDGRGVRASMVLVLLPGIVSLNHTVHAVQAVLLIAIMAIAATYVAMPIG